MRRRAPALVFGARTSEMAAMGETRKPRGRQQQVRVKTARRRPAASTRWLARQLNDPYVAEAKRAGFRARSAFKLIEIDDRFRLLKPGARVLDLGAAPGGWTQVALQRTKGPESGGSVVAIDILEMDPLAGATVLRGDATDPGMEAAIRDGLGGPASAVLSDMAAPTTGHRPTDHLRTMVLAEAATDIALSLLAPGGAFVTKLFQGGAERELLALIKRSFAEVRHVKPDASRKESVELYLVATGRRADTAAAPDPAPDLV